MISKVHSLEEILAHVWGTLARGGADSKHPYHFPVLATQGDKKIHQRTLVLRQTDIKKRQLISYSDVRTQKIEDIKKNEEALWLFYDHTHKEQIRATSKVTLHHQDELSRGLWEQISPQNRGDYLGPHAPGTRLKHYSNNLTEDFLQQPTEENTEKGWQNFCVLISEVYEIEFLKLMKGGHLRCSFLWEDKQWHNSWVAP